MVNRRPLSEEEKKLWEQATRNDMKLSHRHIAAPPPAVKPSGMQRAPEPVAPRLPAVRPQAELKQGSYAGIDGSTAQRFRRGDYPIDATLDLHGKSREKAHMALSAFLRGHYERGSRCVLVITGKGTPSLTLSRDAGEGIRHSLSPKGLGRGYEEKGILRESLPEWLAEPGLKPLVLAFDTAQPKHGGSGAFYVLLRRKR